MAQYLSDPQPTFGVRPKNFGFLANYGLNVETMGLLRGAGVLGDYLKQQMRGQGSRAASMPAYGRGRFGGYGGGEGFAGGYGTGPQRPRHYPDSLGPNPSIESLAAAALNDQEREINNLHNKGGGGRIEDVAAAGRNASENAFNQAGFAEGSLARVQGTANAAVNAMNQGVSHEADREAQLRRDRVAAKDDLSDNRRQAADSIYGQHSDARRIALAEDRADLERYMAETRE